MTLPAPIPSIVAPMTDTDRAIRAAIGQRRSELIHQSICPSCQQFIVGDVFPKTAERTYYDDDLVSVQLEQFPRAIGHTIILSRAHHADIADMPVALGSHMMHLVTVLANALKEVLGAEKVYLHTMCSGALSHLHLQLLPRLPGEPIGGHVFASQRGVLVNYASTRDALATTVKTLLQ